MTGGRLILAFSGLQHHLKEVLVQFSLVFEEFKNATKVTNGISSSMMSQHEEIIDQIFFHNCVFTVRSDKSKNLSELHHHYGKHYLTVGFLP